MNNTTGNASLPNWDSLPQVSDYFSGRFRAITTSHEIGRCLFDCTETLVGSRCKYALIDVIQPTGYYGGSRDFDSVFTLLEPVAGVFFEKLHQLSLNSPYFRFEMSVADLPEGLQKALRSNNCSVLLRNRLNVNSRSLHLLPYEFFWLKFCVHFIESMRKPRLNVGWSGTVNDESGSSVFHALLESYLNVFLSNDVLFREHSRVVTSDNVFLLGNSVDSPSVRNQTKSQFGSEIRTPLNLLKKSWLASNSMHDGHFAVEQLGHYKCDLVTKAESFIQILTDCFLTYPIYCTGDSDGGLSWMQDAFVMVIRMVVKSVLRFALSPNQVHPSVMEFRKVILCRFVQMPLYNFFKAAMRRWPMDGSFLYLLETWLSFLQPWRYSHQIRLSGLVSPEWDFYFYQNFLLVAEPYLLLLERFSRMDLCAVRNAYMLLRFLKVLSAERFVPLLRQIDTAMIDLRSHQVPDPGDTDLIQLHRHVVALESSMILEGGYGLGLFGAEQMRKVHELLLCIESALVRLKEQEECDVALRERRKRECRQRTSGWMYRLLEVLGMSEAASGAESADRERRHAEWRKATGHLHGCMHCLSICFEDLPHSGGDLSNMSGRNGYISPGSSFNSSFGRGLGQDGAHELDDPDFEIDPATGALRLSAIGQYQVLNHLRRPNLCKIGARSPPECLPAQSHEVGFLVKPMNGLSAFLNRDIIGYDRLKAWYYRDGMKGRVAKFFLQPPTLATRRNKAVTSKTFENLPPRLCFRFVASHRFLLLCFLFCLVAWLFVSPAKCVGAVAIWYCFQLMYFCFTSTDEAFDYSN